MVYVIGYLFVMVPWVVGVVVIARRATRGMRRAWRDVYRPMLRR